MFRSWQSTERTGQVICKECLGRLVFDPDNGERVCSTCGVVNENSLDSLYLQSPDTNSQHRLSESDSLAARYGLDLPTVISEANVDAYGKSIHDASETGRLRRINNYIVARDSKTRNLVKALREIRRVTEKHNLGSSVAERAFQICQKAMRSGIRGKSVKGLAVAAVTLACREQGVGLQSDQFDGELGELNQKSIRHHARFLEKESDVESTVPSPMAYVSRVAAAAGLGGPAIRKALEILNRVKDDQALVGKRPISLAASSLYLASVETGEHTTQLRIASAARVTTATLRKRTSEIAQILGAS